MQSHVLARASMANGELVVLTQRAWSHIAAEHPEMTVHRNAVMAAAATPEVVADDPRPGRRRHYRSGVGPSQWVRVIVDFNQSPARIVTAHAHRKEPRR